ncbi:DUF4349 domain-containing protein [Antiquaquibacter soli]|uniref:DUF4349 domain-containing protein n=1 Tax=Antiquaquibacter soli TaxID=3064523 RepID=A0ABT9BSK9_9MICO|nr:DUF4349 domain-containing protein [Protaetiibacter sp. WY-16]MDO7883614.1 DUF4349 domain-containing protein [Protaetiibacter sp. WY-16]
MRRILILPTALVLSALALTGCAAGGGDYSSSDSAGGVTAPQAMDNESIATEDGTRADSADRQVIVTGWMTVTVEEPLEAAVEAVRIAESVGGRVDGRQEYAPVDGDKGSATLTLRLPAEGLSATLDKLKELGDVQEVSLNSTDVTMATQDLDARITALSASIDRLLALLEKSTDIDTLISLETAISDRQAQLESLEAERRYYADQVALSTVTLNLVSVADAPVEEPVTFWDGLVAGWTAFVAFFAGLLVVLGALIPWLVLAGIITAIILLLVRASARRKERAATAAAAPVVAESGPAVEAEPAAAAEPAAPAPAPRTRKSPAKKSE